MTDPDKGWQLPTVVSPTEFWCYKIYVPKDIAYLRALRGAIGELAYNWNWQRDTSHTASIVVQNWIDKILEADIAFNLSDGECVPTCEEILECILTDADVRNAIASLSSSSNIQSNSPQNSTNLAGQLVNNPAGCNNDIIYGMTVQLVEFADRLIKDLLEGIKASNLAGDNVGFLISAIPVIETLPIDELFELGYKIANDMEVAYLGASTELLKTEIACELFCLAQSNNCVLTLEMVRDYFQTKADVTFSYDDPLAFIVDFITGVFVSNAVYYGMNILFFQIMAFGGKFLEYFFEDYLRVINSMFNDPNPDWSTECDTCPDTWNWNSDFDTDENIWEITDLGFGALANWASSVGYTTADASTGAGSYSRIIRIATPVFTPTQITHIEFNFDMTKGITTSTATALAIVATKNNDSLIQQLRTFTSTSDGASQTFELDLNEPDIKQILILVRCWTGVTTNYAGATKLNSINVQGEGFNPFE